MISIHVETEPHLQRALQLIRDGGAKAGIAINPATPAEALSTAIEFCDFVLVMTVNPGFGGQKFIEPVVPKIRHISQMIREQGASGGDRGRRRDRCEDRAARGRPPGPRFSSPDRRFSANGPTAAMQSIRNAVHRSAGAEDAGLVNDTSGAHILRLIDFRRLSSAARALALAACHHGGGPGASSARPSILSTSSCRRSSSTKGERPLRQEALAEGADATTPTSTRTTRTTPRTPGPAARGRLVLRAGRSGEPRRGAVQVPRLHQPLSDSDKGDYAMLQIAMVSYKQMEKPIAIRPRRVRRREVQRHDPRLSPQPASSAGRRADARGAGPAGQTRVPRGQVLHEAPQLLRRAAAAERHRRPVPELHRIATRSSSISARR